MSHDDKPNANEARGYAHECTHLDPGCCAGRAVCVHGIVCTHGHCCHTCWETKCPENDAPKWRRQHFDAYKDLEFTRDRVGTPGCDIRLRAEHLIAIVNDWHRYKSALCRIGSLGNTNGEAADIAVEALRADGDDVEYQRFVVRFK